MANRQDRRYAAKLARQAAKGDRSPAAKALLKAAADFMADQPIEIDFSMEDMDRAWDRLKPVLWDQLEEDFPLFRRALFDDSASLQVTATSAEGEEIALDIQTVLFPVVGKRATLEAFAADQAKLDELARSLRESGVVPERSSVAIMPSVIAAFSADLDLSGPDLVHMLTKSLAETLLTPDGADGALTFEEKADMVLEWMPSLMPETDGEEEVSGFLVGVVAVEIDTTELSEDELEAQDLSLAAAGQSWADTYASDLPFRLGGLSLWSDAGVASAWHKVACDIDAEIERRGLPREIAEVHAYLEGGVEESLLAVRCGVSMLGPFRVSNRLVFTDVDGFAAEAESLGGELIEYERAEPLLKLIAATGAR
ncbi:hypothetical protein [Aureimonas sp. AU20]|uniref:hypothetical protein n=1 Tax=Aureimonas sp. AU20 TaxID=1349819 RepID=UPI0007205E56|nr:hypothetical protein [Aureimonas sp. AU20]ALN73044.1 hypothetical protein M673_09965 [Aureimonas sp. AU20]